MNDKEQINEKDHRGLWSGDDIEAVTINNVLKTITDALEQDISASKFTFEREYTNWNVRYRLFKNAVKQDVILSYDFVAETILGLYPVSELITACKHELEKRS